MTDTTRRTDLPDIPPFWQRIPRFFLYGLHWRVLTLAVSLALLNAYLLKGPFIIVLYAVTVRYAMAALERTAGGDLDPPPFDWQVLGQGYGLPVKLFVILVVYGIALAWLGVRVGPFLAMALYLLGTLLFPALIMMLVLSGSLATALNPLGWIHLAWTIGWPYLAVFGLWLSLGTAQETASGLLLSVLPEDALLPFWLAVNTVFSAIGFHMMGYALLQYHQEIGDPLSAGTRLAGRGGARGGLRTPLFEQFLHEGRIEAAAAELMGQVRLDPQDLDKRRKVHNFLLSYGQDRLMAENAQVLLDEWLAAGKLAPAASLYGECRDRGCDCRPSSPVHHLALLRQLRRIGRAKDAVHLSKGFHKRFPASDDAPAVYLEAAAALSEDLHRDDLARQLVDFVLERYPQHAQAGEAQRYRDILARLGDQPA